MTRACREAGGHMREGAEAFRPRDHVSLWLRPDPAPEGDEGSG